MKPTIFNKDLKPRNVMSKNEVIATIITKVMIAICLSISVTAVIIDIIVIAIATSVKL